MSNLKPLDESDIKCPEIKMINVAAILIDEKGNRYGPVSVRIEHEYLNTLQKLKNE